MVEKFSELEVFVDQSQSKRRLFSKVQGENDFNSIAIYAKMISRNWFFISLEGNHLRNGEKSLLAQNVFVFVPYRIYLKENLGFKISKKKKKIWANYENE